LSVKEVKSGFCKPPAMENLSGNLFVKNYQIMPAHHFDPNFMSAGQSVYEVVRIQEGVALFWEEHLERLQESLRIVKRPGFTGVADSHRLIKALAKQCSFKNGNVKLVLHYYDDRPASEYDFYLYFIEHRYPSAKQYRQGVDTITCKAVRSNPNAKVAQLAFRERINQEIIRQNVFEAILLDEEGYLSEGSRSNFFMIKDNTLYTAPLRHVLPGITRRKVLEICHQQQIPLREAALRVTDLVKMEAVFLTGTSPQVLPIKSIDNMVFASADHPLVLALMKDYEKLVASYILNH